MLLQAVDDRYKEHHQWAHDTLYKYYMVSHFIAQTHPTLIIQTFLGQMVDGKISKPYRKTDIAGYLFS